jgi:hypothetical protein
MAAITMDYYTESGDRNDTRTAEGWNPHAVQRTLNSEHHDNEYIPAWEYLHANMLFLSQSYSRSVDVTIHLWYCQH